MKLSKKEIKAMKEIEKGADVYSYATAGVLRKLNTKHPELLHITSAMNAPSGEKQQPFFGAILSKEGKKMLKSAS